MGPPVGPTGAALSCTGEHGADAAEAPKFRVAASTTWSATRLSFGGDDSFDADSRRRAVAASFEWRALDDLTVTAGAGAAIDGRLVVRGVRSDLGAGPLGTVGVAYRFLAGEGWVPFILGGATFAASTASTHTRFEDGRREDARLTALDFRGSVTVGEVFGDAFVPYVVARGFGGPIFWTRGDADVVGTDKFKYQFGGGLLATARYFDAYFELVPLGERAAVFGGAVTF